MENEEWIESKREVQTNAAGEIATQTITYAKSEKKKPLFEPKDWIDLTIKVVGIAAIFIPIFLFYSQQKSEIERQKYLLEFQAYSELDVELHTFIDKYEDPIGFEKARNLLQYELIPKANLFHNTKVTDSLKPLKNLIDFFVYYYNRRRRIDSVLAACNIFYDRVFNPYLEREERMNKKDMQAFLIKLQYLVSGFEDAHFKLKDFIDKIPGIYLYDSVAVISEDERHFVSEMAGNFNGIEKGNEQSSRILDPVDLDPELRRIVPIVNALKLSYFQHLSNLDSILIQSNKFFQ
jgi:hypothetical protein